MRLIHLMEGLIEIWPVAGIAAHWSEAAGLDSSAYGIHSMWRPPATLTCILRVQRLPRRGVPPISPYLA